MAWPKFLQGLRGRGSQNQGAQTAPASVNVELLRKRARHRLIGAAVLLLLGVIGFPLIFDSQPRPMDVDVSIEIPSQAKAKPLLIPPEVSASATAASTPEPTAPVEAAPVAKAEPKPEPKPNPAPAPATASKEEKPAPRTDDGARAQALLEGKTPPPTTAAEATSESGRYVVQVGAFAQVAKAREVRLKVEKLGLKTYTQVVETKEGKRIRVRVGPFADKAQADKAAAKLKAADVSASVLGL